MYDTIITHEGVHGEECLGINLLKNYGRKKFPGVECAKIEFWKTNKLPKEKTEDDFLEEGKILVGLGGGRYDDKDKNGNRKKDCTAMLVAKDLGIDNLPELQEILRYAQKVDAKPVGVPLDIFSLIKTFHLNHPDDSMIGFEWFNLAIQEFIKKQIHFHTVTKAEFEKNHTKDRFPGPNGELITSTTVSSDDPLVSNFARTEWGGRFDLIIQIKSTGHVQIFTNQFLKIYLYDVARIIRLEEQKKRNITITTDWEKLGAVGEIPEIPWFLHNEGKMLLNGTLTISDVSPTALSYEQVDVAMRIALNPNLFDLNFSKDCKKGICKSSTSKPCRLFQYGFQRCQDIRQKNKKN
ncbi:MAG: hypothetical protein ABH830_05060 [Patescibacteria group bacterium]